MRRRGWSVVGFAALTVALVGLRPTGSRAPKQDAQPARAASPRALQLAWPRGASFVYAVRYRGETRARLGAEAAVDGTWTVELDLLARSFGDRGGATLLELSIPTVQKDEVTMGGRNVLGTSAARAALTSASALVEMLPDGRPRALHLRPGTSPVFAALARALLRESRFSLPATAQVSWRADERTASGDAVSEYRLIEHAPPRLLRTRARYDSLAVLGYQPCVDCKQTLASTAEVRLGDQSELCGMMFDESLAATRPPLFDPLFVRKTHLQMTLVERAHLDPRAISLDGFAEVPLDDPVDAQAMRKEHLQKRVAGLSLAELGHGVAQYGEGKEVSAEFAWRASGLLILHPELCAHLAERFARATTPSRARELILDLLASSGHAQAQAAMRTALGSAAAEADPAYSSLLQRFSFLSAPDPQSAAFVAMRHRRSPSREDHGVWTASAYALGALAGGLETGGQRELAAQYRAILVSELEGARSSAERAELVAALGNAHSDEDSALLTQKAQAPEPEVRAAALRALRRSTLPEARAVLTAALADEDLGVRRMALHTLGEGTLSAPELAAMSRALDTGALGPGLDHELVTVLSSHAREGDVRPMLEQVAARSVDPRLRDRVRFVLAQLGPSPR